LYCRLQELPATLGALLDLKALFVGHNQLQQLPGSISRLQLLNTLHAGRELLQCTHVNNTLVVQPCIGQQDVRTSSVSSLTASIWLVTCEL
jgi:Leucine-rich repeat (LRR) protein